MLQPLLADRFKLKVHKETKLRPIYELVIAKNGPKLKEAKPGDTGTKGTNRDSRPGMTLIARQGIPIAMLADRLSETLHRTIVDKTGLTGKYESCWSGRRRMARLRCLRGREETTGEPTAHPLQIPGPRFSRQLRAAWPKAAID